MTYRPPVGPGEVRPGRLIIGGHSYNIGTGAQNPAGNLDASYGWHSMLRDAMGGPAYSNLSLNGVASFIDGHTLILQGITSVRTTGVAAAMPNAGTYCFVVGLNDLSEYVAGLKDVAQDLNTFEYAISNFLLRPLQAVVIEDSDAGWTYTGPWSTTTTSRHSGTSIKAVTSHTSLTSAAYTIPSTFDGSYVHVGLVASQLAPTSVAIKVAGVTVKTVNLANIGRKTIGLTSTAGPYTVTWETVSYPVRIPATAGQTVTIEVAAGGGGGGFLTVDYIALEATPRPLVMFANISRLNTYASLWVNITDALVAAYNARIKSVIDALGIPEVIYVDVDSKTNKEARSFYTDNTHLSTRGHSLYASAFVEAMQKAPVTSFNIVGGGNKRAALLNGIDLGDQSPVVGLASPLYVTPGTGTTLATSGAAMAANTGTVAHPTRTVALGNRATFTTAATAAATASASNTDLVWARGNAGSFSSGLFFHCRFGMPGTGYDSAAVAGAGTRIFMGLTDQTVATALATDNPAGNRIGLRFTSVTGGLVDTMFTFLCKDGTTESTAVASNVDFPPLDATAVYDFFLGIKPGGLVAYFQLDNITANKSLNATLKVNLPTTTAFMRAMFGISTVNTTAKVLSLYRMSAITPNANWPDTG